MKVLLIGLAALGFFCTASAQNNENIELKKQIESLELQHAKAILRGDTIALDSLTDNQIKVNHPTNKIITSKKELRDLIRSHLIQYSSFERHPEDFFFYNNMVVVMGNEMVVPAKGLLNEGKNIQRRYTDVWMLKDNKWKLFVRHANNVCN